MRKHHPYASIFPMMSDDEMQQLAEDIRTNGQRLDVVIDTHGLVLDGRNRLAACMLAGVTPREYVFEGTDREKLHLIFSLNVPRRHLNESQRAMAAARMAAELQTIEDIQTASANLPHGKKAARPRDVAAERMSVSARSVQDAATVLQSGDTEAIAAVDAGETAVSAQAKRVRAQAAEARETHTAADESSLKTAAATAPRKNLSREEKAAIRRDITAMVRGYPASVRGDVAVLVVDQCQRLLIGIRPGDRETGQ